MQLPGLLVEYLINGSVAMLWIVPILSMLGISLPKNPTYLALLFPGLYVIGMTVDYLARITILPWKRKIKNRVYAQIKDKKISSHIIQAKLATYSPELTIASEMRSSRDRIARGTLLNATLATIFYIVPNIQNSQINYSIVILGIVCIFLSLATWSRYQYLSYDYEVAAYMALDEKLKKEKPEKLLSNKGER